LPSGYQRTQWFITFWATTKIGAVLVTVNTAYKIYEVEYLLRQSDTHTLVMIDGFKDSNYVEIIKELCPELETAEPGKPLHIKRLPFLRNIITIESNKKAAFRGMKQLPWRKKCLLRRFNAVLLRLTGMMSAICSILQEPPDSQKVLCLPITMLLTTENALETVWTFPLPTAC